MNRIVGAISILAIALGIASVSRTAEAADGPDVVAAIKAKVGVIDGDIQDVEIELDAQAYFDGCGQVHGRTVDALVKLEEARHAEFIGRLESCAMYEEVKQFCDAPLSDPFAKPVDYRKVATLASKDYFDDLERHAASTTGDVPEWCARNESNPAPFEDALEENAPDTNKSGGGVLGEALGPSWQDAVVRGIAAFISARLKAELELLVQDRLADDLCKVDKMKTLLDNTCTVIEGMRGQDGPIAWGTVKSAVEEDLLALPAVLVDEYLVQRKRYGIAAALTGSVLVMESVRRGKSPVVVLGGLTSLSKDVSPCKLQPALCTMWMLGVSGQVIGVGLEEPVGANSEHYGEIAARLMLYRAFEGTAENARPDFVNEEKYPTLVAAALADSRLRLQSVTTQLKELEAEQKDGKALDFETFADLARDLSYILEGGAVVGTGVERDDASCKDLRSAEAGQADAKAALEKAQEDLAEKPQDAALIAAEKSASEDDDAAKKKLRDEQRRCVAASFYSSTDLFEAIHDARTRDFQGLVVRLFAIAERLDVEIPPALLKYGPFLADFASAQDAESIEKALESVAEPVGSYKKKRGDAGSIRAARYREREEFSGRKGKAFRQHWRKKRGNYRRSTIKKDKKTNEGMTNLEFRRWWRSNRLNEGYGRRPRVITINAYAGARGGGDILVDSQVDNIAAGQFGLFAPMGLEMAWGLGRSSSVGLFVSVIDVGALADFRFGDANVDDTPADDTTMGDGPDNQTDAEVDTQPQIGLRQVVSPGLYLMFGIPKTPFTLGFGGAFSPRLRSVTLNPNDENATTEQESVFTLSGVFAVDIPVVVIHKRHR
ncbi:MAG: hypothetical protein AAF799_08190 [Myxococcota bacterium]